MTDIPTAPDNKPSNLRQILEDLVENFAAKYKDSDVSTYWWGHDTNLGDQSEAFDEAVAAITGLLPEKLAEITADDMPLSKAKREGFNAAIDTTLRNFTGQTDGEGE